VRSSGGLNLGLFSMNPGSGSQVMDNSSATVMGGPKGVAVLAASERDGEMEYVIQTTAPTGWRPVCAALSLSGSVDAVQETAGAQGQA
jgi:hypothetical protein